MSKRLYRRPALNFLLLFILIAAGVMSAIHSDKVSKVMREEVEREGNSITGEKDFSGGIFLQQFLEVTE